MSVVRDCVSCRERIEPDDGVRVSRHEPTDMPGLLEPVMVERPGFVHAACELNARLGGWRRPGDIDPPSPPV